MTKVYAARDAAKDARKLARELFAAGYRDRTQAVHHAIVGGHPRRRYVGPVNELYWRLFSEEFRARIADLAHSREPDGLLERLQHQH